MKQRPRDGYSSSATASFVPATGNEGGQSGRINAPHWSFERTVGCVARVSCVKTQGDDGHCPAGGSVVGRRSPCSAGVICAGRHPLRHRLTVEIGRNWLHQGNRYWGWNLCPAAKRKLDISSSVNGATVPFAMTVNRCPSLP